MKDYYYILGLKRNATEKEINVAFHKLSKKFHPDANGGDNYYEEILKEINEAYAILGDITKREIYDKQFTNSQLYTQASSPKPSESVQKTQQSSNSTNRPKGSNKDDYNFFVLGMVITVIVIIIIGISLVVTNSHKQLVTNDKIINENENKKIKITEFNSISLGTTVKDLKFLKGKPDQIVDKKIWVYGNYAYLVDNNVVTTILFSGDWNHCPYISEEELYTRANIYNNYRFIGFSLSKLTDLLGQPTNVNYSQDDFTRIYYFDDFNLFFLMEQDQVVGFGISLGASYLVF